MKPPMKQNRQSGLIAIATSSFGILRQHCFRGARPRNVFAISISLSLEIDDRQLPLPIDLIPSCCLGGKGR
jgi:hypothetical protein